MTDSVFLDFSSDFAKSENCSQPSFLVLHFICMYANRSGMWRGKPRKDILLPINHWDYCSDPTCTRCRKLTLSIPKKIHQQLTRNRRLHYDLYMTTRLLTCSVQMLSVAVGKMIGCISRRAWEVVRNTVRHECRSTFPSPISKK